MEPIRYVERLERNYREQGFPPYQWTVNAEAPITPLGRPLSECRVSALTSGGLSCQDTAAWKPNARNIFRLDAIASDAPADGFQIHDAYYDHADADNDVNCVFPIDRLRDLVADGTIGSLAPRLWSGFMGRIYKRRAVIEEHAPALAKELADDNVDLFLLVPA